MLLTWPSKVSTGVRVSLQIPQGHRYVVVVSQMDLGILWTIELVQIYFDLSMKGACSWSTYFESRQLFGETVVCFTGFFEKSSLELVERTHLVMLILGLIVKVCWRVLGVQGGAVDHDYLVDDLIERVEVLVVIWRKLVLQVLLEQVRLPPDTTV